MACINEAQLRRQIKAGEYKNAYLIYGDENYLKSRYVSLLKSKLVDDAFEAFNYHLFEGESVDIDDALKDAQTLPMMGEYNLVIIKDYPFSKVDDAKPVLEYLDDLSPSTVLIIWFERISPDGKSAAFKKLLKAFDSVGVVARLDKRSESDVAKLLVSEAKKRKAVLDTDNARYLICVCSNDLVILLNELEKLAGFVGGGEITKEIIDNMATKCLQARIYDLSKFIVAGKCDEAYKVLDTLLEMKEKPVIILSTISGVYVDMYRVKCAKTAGYSYDDVARHFNYKNREFALRNATRDCAKLSKEQLRASLDIITETDIKMKSTSTDEKLLIEELIIKLVLTAQEKI